MRALSDYSLKEWACAVPLAQRLRRARNRLVDRIYRDRRAEGQAALVARLKADPNPVLAFTVAFNLPEGIDLLSEAMARFVTDATLVVCDNSTDPAARAANARICAARGPAYCPLPPSPCRGGRNGSRSHAVALNWIFANLVRPVAPRAFALLDRDLIPLERSALAQTVAGQPCYGMVRHGERRDGAWYLWPGFSVFDYAAVRHLALDFGTDTPLTLDTGGQNWSVLYRTLDLKRLTMAQTCRVRIRDPKTGEGDHSLMVDGWVHVGGAGHRGGGREAMARARRAFDADPDGLAARLRADAEPDPT